MKSKKSYTPCSNPKRRLPAGRTITVVHLALLTFLLCRCNSDSIEKEETVPAATLDCFPAVEDKYTYPVTPGSEEWQTANDVYSLCQLPDSVLKSISTPGLIDALRRYKRNPEQWTTVISIAYIMLDDPYFPMAAYYRNNTRLYEQSIATGYVFSAEQSDLIISLANSFVLI
ncbi:MAG: hypothetical protein LBP25_00260 [Tannerellaceae bacterium]|nr:hypothetical protein [Tannerellaceae bacterium]